MGSAHLGSAAGGHRLGPDDRAECISDAFMTRFGTQDRADWLTSRPPERLTLPHWCIPLWADCAHDVESAHMTIPPSSE